MSLRVRRRTLGNLEHHLPCHGRSHALPFDAGNSRIIFVASTFRHLIKQRLPPVEIKTGDAAPIASGRRMPDIRWSCGYAPRALYFFIRRDLRRAALFGWITPLDATRSSVLVA